MLKLNWSNIDTFNYLDTNGLVAHYKFNEGEGNTLYDHSGYNNHGTIYGASWIGDGDICCYDAENDVDGDGILNVQDVVILIGVILG